MNGIPGRWMDRRTRLRALCCAAWLGAASLAHGATLAVQPRAGEPTTRVDLRGGGMAPFEAVELRYDGAALGVAQANAEGEFTADDLVIPAAALPGRRDIAAVGRSSGTRATVPFVVRSDWPQFHRGTFRHGETPHENVLGAHNVAQLRLLWDVPLGPTTDPYVLGSPVLANGLLYVITPATARGKLLALDPATGATRWSQLIGYSFYCNASPAVAQGRVYAPASRRMAAFDARSGAVRWRAGDSWCTASATPTVLNGKLFTVSPAGPNLEARDPASGRLLWTRRVCIGKPPACSYASSFGPLAAGDGIVYVTNYGGAMAAYTMDTGRQLWSRYVGSGVIDSAPVVEGDVVYVSVHDNRLYALNRRTGAELWSAPTGRFNHATPALAYGLLYVGSSGNGVTAIDAQTGAVRWQQSALGDVSSSPAVANGLLYLTAGDGRLYALDARTGAVLHSVRIAPAGSTLGMAPVVADGKVYVGTGYRLLAFGL